MISNDIELLQSIQWLRDLQKWIDVMNESITTYSKYGVWINPTEHEIQNMYSVRNEFIGDMNSYISEINEYLSNEENFKETKKEL